MTYGEALSIHKRVSMAMYDTMKQIAYEIHKEQGMTPEDATDYVYERLRHIVLRDDTTLTTPGS